MKLGIVTHKLVKGDGQGRVNYEVALAALHQGYEVILLASEVAPELASNDRVTWIRIPVAGWPTELLRNQVFAWRTARWLRKHRTSIDLVKLNGAITWTPADVNAVHMVHSAWLQSPVHTARVRRGPYAWYQRFYTTVNARWEKRAFRQAGVVVAVSDRVREQIVDIGIPNERVCVIPNGVDLDEFFPASASRKELGLPEDKVLALFAGDIRTALKNLDTMLRALAAVPDVHLAVAGDTAGSPYPAMAAQLGLEGRVHFLGYRRDLPVLMRAADLFVLPSRYESFSLVLLEAMASGLPVITARTVGAASLVTPACGIVLEDPDDTDALVDALRTLAADDALRETMGRAGRAVAEHHSFKQMAQRYVDLFEELRDCLVSRPAGEHEGFSVPR